MNATSTLSPCSLPVLLASVIRNEWAKRTIILRRRRYIGARHVPFVRLNHGAALTVAHRRSACTRTIPGTTGLTNAPHGCQRGDGNESLSIYQETAFENRLCVVIADSASLPAAVSVATGYHDTSECRQLPACCKINNDTTTELASLSPCFSLNPEPVR